MNFDETSHRAERSAIGAPAGGAGARRDHADFAADAPLSAERLTEVRRRIFGGVYDSAAVVDAVARRILERGDL
ncbi:MAG TPA: hypothetical protein VF041_01545 [Gemmatimonadaceae bacterium]